VNTANFEISTALQDIHTPQANSLNRYTGYFILQFIGKYCVVETKLKFSRCVNNISSRIKVL
jgi:hypothetical protein